MVLETTGYFSEYCKEIDADTKEYEDVQSKC